MKNMAFEIEKGFLSSSSLIKVLLDISLVATAVTTFTTTLLLSPNLDRQTKIALTSTGLSSLVLWSLNKQFSGKLEKVSGAIAAAQWTELKNHLAAIESREKLVHKVKQVDQLIQHLPQEQLNYWMQQTQYADYPIFLENSSTTNTNEVMGNGNGNGNGQWVIGNGSGNGELLSHSSRDDFDCSWIDKDFINSSKAVFGAKGSGKSYWLAYEASRFLMENSGGILFIGDRHWDEEESLWLPGISRDDVAKNFLRDTTEGIYQIFKSVHKELMDRINSKDRKRSPLKFICDEFLGFMDECTDAQKKEVLLCIKASQHQGRKYGINLTLGLHSIKKGESGIDSSVLFQMDTLALGDSIADRTNAWPASFSLEKLWNGIEEIKSQGSRACVVRKLGESPLAVAMPVLQISQLKLDNSSSDVDWYVQLKDWAIAHSSNPSDGQIEKFWFDLTGKKLSGSAVELLQEKIGEWRGGNNE